MTDLKNLKGFNPKIYTIQDFMKIHSILILQIILVVQVIQQTLEIIVMIVWFILSFNFLMIVKYILKSDIVFNLSCHLTIWVKFTNELPMIDLTIIDRWLYIHIPFHFQNHIKHFLSSIYWLYYQKCWIYQRILKF